jgi:Contractile injection system tube protein
MSDYVNKLRISSFHMPSSGSALSVLSSIAQMASGGIFELQINPEQYARNFKINYHNPDEQGNTKPEILDLKFTIDGTGVVPIQQPALDLVTQAFAAADTDAQLGFVAAKLAQLQMVVYGVQDESHRPPFMVVNWGKLVFLGQLLEMVQTVTLSHFTGVPLRVEVNLKVQEYKLPSIAAAALSFLSPDLTRQRIVKSSDTILTLTKEVYEKPDYYLEVAKANELTNFRKLKTNTHLIFPPVV